jgi:hypothetical protein
MATHDYNIANQTAPNFRSDLNNALLAVVTQNSKATAPTTTFGDMLWYDSANNQLKKRNEANSAWVTLGTINEGAGTFIPTGANGLSFDVNSTLSVNSGTGVTATFDSDGSFSTGTYTPTPVGGNFKSITNTGAFTFAAPTVSGDYTLVVRIANSATSGAITLSGFSRVTGDSFTTTSTHNFLVFITKLSASVLVNVVAAQ